MDVRDDYGQGGKTSSSCDGGAGFVCAKKENKLLRSIKKTRTMLGMTKKRGAFESRDSDAVLPGLFDKDI